MNVNYIPFAPQHFAAVIALGNHVHGDNYLDPDSLTTIYHKGWQDDINASWIAVIPHGEFAPDQIEQSHLINEGLLVGFRLTYAPQNWDVDEWCTPTDWPHPKEQVCYFKCNTVDATFRGLGIGATLLKRSIEQAKLQGAIAGIAHIWLASPNNSAYGYFSACGGELVKKHANRWQRLALEENYQCPVCPGICTCTAAEMILPFERVA
ncbi:GNAT family N-acetyltransferase [Alteromonas flava]|uniref:GNAT family N-acetyltransferase n=1 Tax=Alteromonas flava TaxID=2048003 RepID=UPI000C28402C|nr:GNAT family N-acetyltransferase [Alteromonas flava]